MNVHYDPLAAVMALMVTFVASIIHLYSVAFMRDDADYVRYFCYLNLFVFAMLVITVADNLIFVYLGWEGVGFCSYALIGFWYRAKPTPTPAARPSSAPASATSPSAWPWACFLSCFTIFPSPTSMPTPPP